MADYWFNALLGAAAARKPYKRQVAYLESTGTQWIDTGVFAPLGAAVEVEFEPTAVATQAVFGGRTAISTGNSFTLFALTSEFRFDRAGQTPLRGTTVTVGHQYRFRYTNDSAVSLEDLTSGVSWSFTVTALNMVSPSVALFAVNTNGTRSSFFRGRISCWKYWESGALVRDFIPVIDWNDRPAMYDRVSGQMFYNQGSGEFIVDYTDDETFTIDLTITSDNLTFGVQPYWGAGGYCNIVDWGDGATQAATTSGAQLTHTYAAAGTYIVKITGTMYRLVCGSTNPGAVTFCNGNWAALGNITNGNSMFYNCVNMDITVDRLPPGLTTGQSMFNGCKTATLPLKALPDGLTQCSNLFQDCLVSTMSIPRLPAGITGAGYMFYRCRKMTADLDAWGTANPAGWANLTNGNYMLYGAGSDNSPGTVTGSVSAFTARCPNATFTAAFNNTNTTA